VYNYNYLQQPSKQSIIMLISPKGAQTPLLYIDKHTIKHTIKQDNLDIYEFHIIFNTQESTCIQLFTTTK